MVARAREDAERPGPDARDPRVMAAARRRRLRRTITAGIVTLVVLAAVGTYIPMTLLAPAASATITVAQPTVAQPAAVSLALPQVGASAVSVMGADDFVGVAGTNGILASSGGNGALPIASISKLITALVVLGAKPLGATDAGPTLTFSKADSDLYDKYYVMQGTVQSMKTGSTMSERDALEEMLVASACNYAEAVSTWAFGSQARYLTVMKSWLKAHNLTGTRLVEPTGIDPRNVSTPADLIAIGKLALANPAVAAIVKMPSLTIPNASGVANTNELLGVDGIDGIKTGTLAQAGACLLFSAVLEIGAAAPITVVGVVLGGDDHASVDAAVRALLDSIKSGFHEVTLVTKGEAFGSYATPWKDAAAVVAGRTASVLTWSNTPITSTMVTKTIQAGTSGSPVGSVTFVAGKSTVTVPLVLKGSIHGPDDWWRLTHPVEVLKRS
jgi:D-alanyl-D-alanine carboxypeptidase (penicillin-binding protein 5/6)